VWGLLFARGHAANVAGSTLIAMQSIRKITRQLIDDVQEFVRGFLGGIGMRG